MRGQPGKLGRKVFHKKAMSESNGMNTLRSIPFLRSLVFVLVSVFFYVLELVSLALTPNRRRRRGYRT